MKFTTLTCLVSVLALGIGTAQAATGNSVDAETCKKAWSMASPGGDTLSEGQATPYVLDFSMVDSNKDAKIDASEFNAACDKGLVKADAATIKDME